MDFSLSNEQRSWQMTARKFAKEEIRPISVERDEISDPRETFDWEIIKKGSKLGYYRPWLEDIRKDEECADTVGVYLQVDDEGKAHFRMTLGPEVQTLTRAMTAILCKGLDGRTPQEVLELPSDFVTRIVGAELVRVRSQTIYYVLTRIKGICKVYLDRQRMAAVA